MIVNYAIFLHRAEIFSQQPKFLASLAGFNKNPLPPYKGSGAVLPT
jgi:hypothetical protein